MANPACVEHSLLQIENGVGFGKYQLNLNLLNTNWLGFRIQLIVKELLNQIIIRQITTRCLFAELFNDITVSIRLFHVINFIGRLQFKIVF